MTVALFCDSLTIVVKRQSDTAGQWELGEAAQELGIGIATLFRWMKSGNIIAIRIYRRTFIPKSEVERLKKKATAAKQ